MRGPLFLILSAVVVAGLPLQTAAAASPAERRAAALPFRLTVEEFRRIDRWRFAGHFGAITTDTAIEKRYAAGPSMQPRQIDLYTITDVVPVKTILSGIGPAPGVWPCPRCAFQALPPHRIDEAFVGGAGAHMSLDPWAVRLEGQRFLAFGRRPGSIFLGFSRNLP